MSLYNGQDQDQPGQCNARLILGDDYGDNDCTFRCDLPEGHEGPHQESSRMGSEDGEAHRPYGHHVRVQWEGDARPERVWDAYVLDLLDQVEDADLENWKDPEKPENWDWRVVEAELKQRIAERRKED